MLPNKKKRFIESILAEQVKIYFLILLTMQIGTYIKKPKKKK